MRILVTGATGQLGRALVPLLIARGDSPVLLVRDPEKAGRLFPGCELVRGDVSLPGLGLARAPAADAFYHMAADINLGSSHDERVWSVNYQGTVNAVDFCLRNSVPRLYYAGTAYTEKGRNVYEKSKKASERFVEDCAVPHKTIFKIGILVPPEREAASSSEASGAIYLFVNGLARLLDRGGAAERTFRIKGLPGAALNLVHTDAAAAFMAAAEKPGKVWVTHPDPIRLTEMADWVGEVLDARVSFAPDFAMTPAEALFHRLSKPFLPYFLGDEFPSDMAGLPRVTRRFIKESFAASVASGGQAGGRP